MPAKSKTTKKKEAKATKAKKTPAGKGKSPKVAEKAKARKAPAKGGKGAVEKVAKAAEKKPAKKAPKKPPAKPAKKAAPKKPAKAAAKKPTKKVAPKKVEPKKAEAPEAPVTPTPKVEVAEKGRAPTKKAPVPKAPAEPKPQTLLLYGRWDMSEIEIKDAGLARHMNLSSTFLPHSGGRWANKPFAKQRVNLVERLTNNMMRTEKYTGKKGKTVQVVKRAFQTIEKKAKRNPVQVLVEALENAAPREEITRLRFGGISVPRAVDVAPARRLDLALRHLCRGAVSATYKNRKPIHECLAEETLMAAKGDINSYAIGKKEEMERVAASAR